MEIYDRSSLIRKVFDSFFLVLLVCFDIDLEWIKFQILVILHIKYNSWLYLLHFPQFHQ